MSQPTLEDARALSEWHPSLGVLSVYLGFDPADRTGAWRTQLRNGLDTVLDDWELSITSLDWRERKAQSTDNPARAQGVSSSGHDQFDERVSTPASTPRRRSSRTAATPT